MNQRHFIYSENVSEWTGLLYEATCALTVAPGPEAEEPKINFTFWSGLSAGGESMDQESLNTET